MMSVDRYMKQNGSWFWGGGYAAFGDEDWWIQRTAKRYDCRGCLPDYREEESRMTTMIDARRGEIESA